MIPRLRTVEDKVTEQPLKLTNGGKDSCLMDLGGGGGGGGGRGGVGVRGLIKIISVLSSLSFSWSRFIQCFNRDMLD